MAVAAVIAGVFTGIGMMQSLVGLFPPLGNAYNKWAWSKWPNQVPGLGDLISMFYRNELTEGEYLSRAGELGYTNEYATKYLNIGKALLSPADYISLWRRGKISEEELTSRLHNLRYEEGSIQTLKNATEFFPQVVDLVRFAVREVYTPATVEKFGQMEDIPAKYITEAKKAGLPEEQANNFWASHWDLPSPLQGFRMLHRGIIDEDTLKMLLKSLDIMPFWRDMLIKLSYAPLTRVDVRRMHDMGVLSDNEVSSAYQDLGYSPENAGRMLEFTKMYNADEPTNEVKEKVEKAFKEDIITEAKFREYLQSVGLEAEAVQFWVDMATYEKTMNTIEYVKDDLFERYRAGDMDLEAVRTALNMFDLPATYVEAAIAKERFLPSKKLKMPTKADLEGWVVKGIITDEDYTLKMKDLGYREADILLYLESFKEVE